MPQSLSKSRELTQGCSANAKLLPGRNPWLCPTYILRTALALRFQNDTIGFRQLNHYYDATRRVALGKGHNHRLWNEACNSAFTSRVQDARVRYDSCRSQRADASDDVCQLRRCDLRVRGSNRYPTLGNSPLMVDHEKALKHAESDRWERFRSILLE